MPQKSTNVHLSKSVSEAMLTNCLPRDMFICLVCRDANSINYNMSPEASLSFVWTSETVSLLISKIYSNFFLPKKKTYVLSYPNCYCIDCVSGSAVSSWEKQGPIDKAHAVVPIVKKLKRIYQRSTSGRWFPVALKTRMEIEMEMKTESGWGWRRAVEEEGAGEIEETCTLHLYKFMISNITSVSATLLSLVRISLSVQLWLIVYGVQGSTLIYNYWCLN